MPEKSSAECRGTTHKQFQQFFTWATSFNSEFRPLDRFFENFGANSVPIVINQIDVSVELQVYGDALQQRWEGKITRLILEATCSLLDLLEIRLADSVFWRVLDENLGCGCHASNHNRTSVQKLMTFPRLRGCTLWQGWGRWRELSQARCPLNRLLSFFCRSTCSKSRWKLWELWEWEWCCRKCVMTSCRYLNALWVFLHMHKG